MIIGFDLQPLQTEQSRNRGIGRFTKNVMNKILEVNSTDTFKLFFNDNYKEKINLKLTRSSEIVTIHYSNRKDFNNVVNNLIQFFKYYKHDLDILQIFSPFEGYPSNLPVINPYLRKLGSTICTVIHDFIPLHFPEHYLSTADAKKAYYRQLKTIYDSDILFAVSESTRIDAINILGITPKKVIYIGEAVSDQFTKLSNLSPKDRENLKKRYKIKEKFILYAGGIEFRKNIEKSIEAFSKIDKTILIDLSYVIVCEINELEKRHLTGLAKKFNVENNVIFTGYVSDEELNLFYNHCDLFMFPSLIEGFGLPILEAMNCGAPIIGSNSSSIAELIEDKNFMFNPASIEEISSLINKMFSDQQFRETSINHSLQKCKEYSWDEITKKIISTYRSLENENKLKTQNRLKKPKIAFFSPLPPKKSGIANYSANILPLLSKFWDIDIFIDEYVCDDPYLITNFDIYSYLEFERLNEIKHYDSIIYQVGNSDNHIYMFDILKKYPGVVVLHDVYLSGVIFWNTAKIGKMNEFIDEVIYSHGEYGKDLIIKAQKNLISWDNLIWNLQVNKRILDNAKEIIVHSSWDKENILQLYPQFTSKISLVHQFSPIRLNIHKLDDKMSLGFSAKDFIICSFGFIVSTKKIDSIIKNLKTFLQNNENCKYVIVGDIVDSYGELIKKLVTDLGLSNKVILTGYIDDFTYKKYLGICDVSISLRTNARAGTSASVNHSLGAGLATIISDDGPFTDFADGVVIKIKPNEEKNLGKIVDDLHKNPSKITELGNKAREYAEKNLSKDSCVKKYVIAVDKVIPDGNKVT